MRPALVLALVLALTPAAARAQWVEEPFGRTAVVRLATAPFPHPSRSQYRDDRVLVFVPRGFTGGPTVDVVVHYHGHRAEAVESARRRRLREQLAASGVAAVLLCPQGPLRAADSAGGRHEDPGGLAAFLREALGRLAVDGLVPAGARPGRVVLSGHSGAYRVIARGLEVGGVDVAEVYLHDAVYGGVEAFARFGAGPGRRLLSTTTPGGGTGEGNRDLRRRLEAAGVPVATTEDEAALRAARAAVIATADAHDDVTHARGRLARFLATSGLARVEAPRPRLRAVRGAGPGRVVVAWDAAGDPPGGWRVRAAGTDGAPGVVLATVAPGARAVDLPPLGAAGAGAGLVAVTVAAVDAAGVEGPASNAYAATPGAATPGARRALVVDGFARRTGRFRGEAHAFAAAVVASVAAAGWGVDAAVADAVGRSVDPAGYAAVVWLAGDQSTTDEALDRRERALLADHVAAGRALLVSGSEVAFDLGRGAPGERAFLRDVLGAAFAADAGPGGLVTGAGPLASLGAMPFGGAGAPYAVPSPDVLAPAGAGARPALTYADGRAAAVAVDRPGRGRALLVGLPLETLGDADRARLLGLALAWLAPAAPPVPGIAGSLPGG